MLMMCLLCSSFSPLLSFLEIQHRLIITLPGSPKAVNEILPPMMNLCPHAVKLLQAQNDPHPVNTAVKTANEK